MNNTVILIGRLTSNIELRYTNSAKAVVNSTIAVKGMKKDETNFINFQCWGKVAENLKNYCSKGSLIGIRGELRVESFEGKDGNKKRNTYVLAENITFLDTKNKEIKEKTNDEIIMDVVNKKDPYKEMGKIIEMDLERELPF